MLGSQHDTFVTGSVRSLPECHLPVLYSPAWLTNFEIR